jgi:hypothetical protein
LAVHGPRHALITAEKKRFSFSWNGKPTITDVPYTLPSD